MTVVLALLLAGCDGQQRPSGTPTPSQSGRESTKAASQPVQHFWFEYKAQPNPGRRVWVRVDDSTWTELYPNGHQSRYKIGTPVTIQGITGTAVRKVAGDPSQTWTLNDGSFEVFIPDRNSPRLILGFRHYQDGQWTEWQPLALIHPIE